MGVRPTCDRCKFASDTVSEITTTAGRRQYCPVCLPIVRGDQRDPNATPVRGEWNNTSETLHEEDPAAGEYPTAAYAARLAWLLGSSEQEYSVEDWLAGPLVLVQVGVYRVAYGGDAAEEGAVGVGVFDAENEPVHLPGITNEEGWIEAPESIGAAVAWDRVRELVRMIPCDVAFDGEVQA